MRVKICGITCVEDALDAVAAGADAIGLNFVGGPRRIDLDQASEIIKALPAMVTPVALVRVEEEQIDDVLAEMLGEHWVSHLQVYGGVTAKALRRLGEDGFSPIPVVAVRDKNFAASEHFWSAGSKPLRLRGIVLDSYHPDREGGSGRTFCWDWVSDAQEAGRLSGWPPVILAGGLCPDNVAEAIQQVHPFAVDVSSGVELEGQPGRKDPAKMRAFVRNAHLAEAQEE